ncbi:type II secretion system minor pseudopilin GspK [Salinisphaera sp. P385]|uniref:Type II secretion system protein K n=1 Tax=Spectribacter acetivorans TaxID=3075603 RepID=A0ABU3BBN2_9GAMM|nr:type II secretion system minor pseudopilin GspK [Salinisphaera sp. P385]MDT0618673.1 type II secretion system minor pseudopilin GspK [Salinisphaera sp. P385]
MNRQRGVALLTALMVVALVAMLGAGMLTRMNIAMHRGGNLWLDQQALWYAVGVESWVGEILRRDRENNQIDTLEEPWAQPVDYLPIEGGAISGQVIDLQGRLNINNLAGGQAQQALDQFIRLIQLVGETDAVTARAVAQSTRDWIDADIQPTLPDGAEDDYYLGLSPAYRTANRPMTDVSELRSVRGMNAELFQRLAPYITALPTATAVNVNTAPAPVLASIAEGLDLAMATDLVEQREEAAWESVEAFLQNETLAGREISAENLSVASSYFMASGRVSVDRVSVSFASVLQRGDRGGTRVIRHQRNAL